jgi:hypothetical protein
MPPQRCATNYVLKTIPLEFLIVLCVCTIFACHTNHNQCELKQVWSSAVATLRSANIKQRFELKVNTHIQRTYFVLRCEWNLPGTRTVLEINMWQTNKYNRWFWGTVPNHKIAQSLSKQNNGKANCLHKADRGRAHIYCWILHRTYWIMCQSVSSPNRIMNHVFFNKPDPAIPL